MAQGSSKSEDTYSSLLKNHHEPLALDAPCFHPPNYDHLLTTFVWKSQTASSDKNAVLLSKPAESLAEDGAVPQCHREIVLHLRSQKEMHFQGLQPSPESLLLF